MKNEMNKLVPAQLVALARFCAAAMAILNARLFTLLGLLLCACAFAWALYEPNWIRVAAAVAFAVIVYLPLLTLEKARAATETKQGDSNE